METTWKFTEQETTPPVQEYYEEYGSEYNQDLEYNLEDVNGAEPLVAVSQEPAQEEQDSESENDESEDSPTNGRKTKMASRTLAGKG